MSAKPNLKLINVRTYKEPPDTDIMGVSAKAVQRRFGERLRAMIAQHGMPAQAEVKTAPVPPRRRTK